MQFYIIGVLILFAFLSTLLGLFLGTAMKRRMISKDPLRLQGVVVPGQIIKHRVATLGGRDYHFYLTYRYMFEGRAYEYEQIVTMEGFNAVRDGEIGEVLVLPQDPTVTKLAPIDKFNIWATAKKTQAKLIPLPDQYAAS